MFDLDFIDIRFRTCLFQLMFSQNALFLERKKNYFNRQFFIGYPDQSKLLASWLILTGLPPSTPQKQSILYDSTPAILVKINPKCPLKLSQINPKILIFSILYPKIAIFKREFVHAKKCIFFIWSFSKMLHTKFVFLSGPIMNPKLLELAQIILKWKSLGWNFIFIIYNFKLLSSLIWLHNHVIFLSVFSVASFWNTQIATKTIR